MDWLILVLEVVFMLPMAFRALPTGASRSVLAGELRSSLRSPGLLVHEAGLLVVWIGVGIHFWTGRIEHGVTARSLAAVLLHGAAVLLMFWSFAVLGSWRLLPTIEEGHDLCVRGPYRVLRHPIYLAFDLLGAGAVVSVPSPMVVLGALLMIAAGEMRARSEERALVAAFGGRYRDYMGRVPRLIPGVY